MTTVDILAQIRSTLVEPVAGFWTDEELIRWINRAQSDYVNRTRVLEDVDYTSTQNGVGSYPLPSNCLSIRAVFINAATTGQQANWKRLTPSNLEKNAQQAPNFTAAGTNQTGLPGSYMVWGRNLILFPIPNTDGSGDIMMFFKSRPLDISVSTEPLGLDDSLHEALIAYTLWRAFEKEKEWEQAQYQRSIYEGYIQHGLRWAKKQSGDQRYRLDIDSPTSLDGGPVDNRFNPLA